MPRPDLPESGVYRMKLAKNASWSCVKIWHGHPIDPDTGEILFERPQVWRALLNGDGVDVWSVWPECSGEPICEAEYEFLLRDHIWAKAHAPNDPAAGPRKSVDLHCIPPLF